MSLFGDEMVFEPIVPKRAKRAQIAEEIQKHFAGETPLLREIYEILMLDGDYWQDEIKRALRLLREKRIASWRDKLRNDTRIMIEPLQ